MDYYNNSDGASLSCIDTEMRCGYQVKRGKLLVKKFNIDLSVHIYDTKLRPHLSSMASNLAKKATAVNLEMRAETQNDKPPEQ